MKAVAPPLLKDWHNLRAKQAAGANKPKNSKTITMKAIYKLAAVAALAVGMATNSYALLVSPGSANQIGTGTETGVPQILAEIQANLGINLSGSELYKQNAGEATDSGGFSGSYSTSFSPNDADASGFTITYGGGSAISANPVYLLVKDGNQNPAWYLYDITGWNGTDVITGSGFWPAGGAISHVSIYGTPGTPPSVPDGGLTLALLGASVAGLGVLRRKLS
jgi:hypothetical protein